MLVVVDVKIFCIFFYFKIKCRLFCSEAVSFGLYYFKIFDDDDEKNDEKDDVCVYNAFK